MIEQLVNLLNGPEKDDYGRLRPTQDNFIETLRLLTGTIPVGCVSTDSNGGVRIEWIGVVGNVHLVVSGDVAYIYHEICCEYSTEDATPERLAYWLLRLIG